MELKVKIHTDTARIPEKAHTGDLGYDVFADEDKWIPYGEYRLISTGISIWSNSYKYGFIIKDRSYDVMITFNPSYLLRKPENKKLSWEDLKKIKQKILELKINI